MSLRYREFYDSIQQLASAKSAGRAAQLEAERRVTAFYSLYALKHLGWTEAQADALRASIWQGSDYPTWEAFVADMKARIAR